MMDEKKKQVSVDVQVCNSKSIPNVLSMPASGMMLIRVGKVGGKTVICIAYKATLHAVAMCAIKTFRSLAVNSVSYVMG